MQKQEVLKLLKSKKGKDIKFIRFLFPDILGRMLNFTIPTSELSSAFDEGKGIDGSSIEGFARVEESDLITVPDPETFKILPWVYESNSEKWREAIMFVDILNTKREHYEGDTRNFLKQTLKKTEKFGKMFVGPELEFFFFDNLYEKPKNTKDLENRITDRGGYFYGGHFGDLRKEIQLYLNKLGIKCEFDHHEVAPSQHEIDLKYGPALQIADSIMLAKYIIKRVARENKIYASFMPKPIETINGSGMHLHISLWEKDRNLFFEEQKTEIINNPFKKIPRDFEEKYFREPISDKAKKYVMGLIKYGKDIQLILNQYVNSYKRLTPGFEAPVYLAYGQKNRSAYIRIPKYAEGKEKATRIELRSPDPSCNPYLALAIIQLAGVQGIKENITFTDPVEENIFEMSEEERIKKGIISLSQNLYEALGYFKESKFIKETLPPHLFNQLINNKELEWKEFSRSVTNFEIEKYYPVL